MDKSLFFRVFGNRDLRREIMKWGKKSRPLTEWTDGNLAAELGYAYILQNRPGIKIRAHSINLAAAEGHINVIDWMLANIPKSRRYDLTIMPVATGRLEVIKWLHQRSLIRNMEQMVRQAIRYDQAKIVEWAIEHGGYNTAVNVDTIIESKMEIVNCLHKHGLCEWTDDAIKFAAERDQLNAIIWLCQKGGYLTYVSAFMEAVTHNRSEIMRWLRDNGSSYDEEDL
jgi:hypothetical protein